MGAGRTEDAREAEFDVVLRPCPGEPGRGPSFEDRWGRWPSILRPAEWSGATLSAGFDEALARLDAMGRAFVEPDGAFVAVGDGPGGRWQIDGNAWERAGRVHSVDVRGRCPLGDLERFLAVWREPGEPLAVELVREGVTVDEPTFLRHAVARATAADA